MDRAARLGIVMALALLTAGLAPARAASVRVPPVGDPAFAFALPAGWTATAADPAGNLTITADDHSGFVELSMLSDPAVAATQTVDLAATILKGVGAAPYAASEPASLAGLQGEAFDTTVIDPQGLKLAMRLLIVRLDPTHAAVIQSVSQQELTPAQAAAFAALIAEVRLTGLAK